MPLDGHAYLVSQGWEGKGNALRQGAIIRPLAIPQKRTLAGLGKDRDEAFPFWDHLFSVAAKTIQVKLSQDDDSDNDNTPDITSTIPLDRTSTGILSNKPPKLGTPASTSGTSTPSLPQQQQPPPSHGKPNNLLISAKREAAKRMLYARFFRGNLLLFSPPPPSDDEEKTEMGNCSFNGRCHVWEEDGGGMVVKGDGGHRTPMAIAKAKVVTTASAGVNLTAEGAGGKKRRRMDEDRVEEKTRKEKKRDKTEDKERREKKDKKERKEEGGKKRDKRKDQRSIDSLDDEDGKRERKRRRKEEKALEKKSNKSGERKRRKRDHREARESITVDAPPEDLTTTQGREVTDALLLPSPAAGVPESKKRKKKRKTVE